MAVHGRTHTQPGPQMHSLENNHLRMQILQCHLIHPIPFPKAISLLLDLLKDVMVGPCVCVLGGHLQLLVFHREQLGRAPVQLGDAGNRKFTPLESWGSQPLEKLPMKQVRLPSSFSSFSSFLATTTEHLRTAWLSTPWFRGTEMLVTCWHFENAKSCLDSEADQVMTKFLYHLFCFFCPSCLSWLWLGWG